MCAARQFGICFHCIVQWFEFGLWRAQKVLTGSKQCGYTWLFNANCFRIVFGKWHDAKETKTGGIESDPICMR